MSEAPRLTNSGRRRTCRCGHDHESDGQPTQMCMEPECRCIDYDPARPHGPVSSLTAPEQIARQPHGHVVTCRVCFYQWWAGPGDLPLPPEERCGRADCPQLVDVEAKAEVRMRQRYGRAGR